MKKKVSLILSIFVVMTLFPIRAEKVDSEKVYAVAQRFLQTERLLRAKDVVQLKYSATQKQMTSRSVPRQLDLQDKVFYYVFNIDENAGGGFVIVTGVDVVTPILGYSNNGCYDENNLPPNFAYWMDYIKQEISHVIVQKLPQSGAIQKKWDDYLQGEISFTKSAVAPLISTTWNQTSPYWNLCPTYNNQRCFTGCVATAMAQIMKFHRHPAQGRDQNTAYRKEELGINVPAVNFAVSYNWNNMVNAYSENATTSQQNAVATLIYHCGVSMKMSYSPDVSSAYTSVRRKFCFAPFPSNVLPACSGC